jgi:ABC-2 type transport system permease protein
MSIIRRIARTELTTLFCSPIAWFILVVFSFLTASNFLDSLENTLLYHDINGYGSDHSSCTAVFFLSESSFFNSVTRNIYIYIPLLTMGLLSRETASGSIKLLYSSPVTAEQIVLGKYLAAIVLGGCLMGVPLLSTLVGYWAIPHFDWAPVLVALLGLYLLICTYCAIGLYLSSLTSYQVVAAVGTLAVLAALTYVGTIGQAHDFVRDLTHWLSLSGRTNEFLQGVLRSDDSLYFLLVIALFLGFTILRITFGRSARSRTTRTLSYLTLFVATLAVGYLSSRPATVMVWDATRTRINSISDESKSVLNAIEGPVTITNYVNLLDQRSTPALPTRFVQNMHLFEQYKRAKPDLTERHVYYYDSTPNGIGSKPKFQGMSLEELRDYSAIIYDLNPRIFLSPDEIRARVDLSSEQNSFVRVIQTDDGRTAYLRNFDDMESIPSEEEITATLKRFTTTPPFVVFVAGNSERSIMRPDGRDYTSFSLEKYAREALINQGFDVATAPIASLSKLSSSTSIVVVADPRQPYDDEQLTTLIDYIDRGGNLLLLTDVEAQPTTNTLLARLGLRSSEALSQHSDDFESTFVLAQTSPDATLSSLPARNQRVSMPGCVALERTTTPSDFDFTPILVADASLGDVTTTTSRYTVAAALTRPREGGQQRIIVVGDADCLSNAELSSQREGYRSGNSRFLRTCFRYLSGDQFPIDIQREPCIDDHYRPNFTTMMLPLRIVLLGILPLGLLLGGVALWFLRRRN